MPGLPKIGIVHSGHKDKIATQIQAFTDSLAAAGYNDQQQVDISDKR